MGHRRKRQQTGQRGRRRHVGWTLMLLFVAGAGSAVRGVSAQSKDDASPARGHAEVIAQGVVAMPQEPAAWRVVTHAATAKAASPTEQAAPAFILAKDGALLVADQKSKTRTRLAPGEAILVREGDSGQRTSLDGDKATYYALDLLPTGQAADAGEGEIVFASMGFPAPSGEHDLDLVRDVLAADETGKLSTGEAPALLLVTSGELEVLIGTSTKPVTLEAGKASSFAGELTLHAAGDPATYVAAVIGPEVSVPA